MRWWRAVPRASIPACRWEALLWPENTLKQSHRWSKWGESLLSISGPRATWDISSVSYILLHNSERLNTQTAFLEQGQSRTLVSWILVPAPALTHCAHLVAPYLFWASVSLTVKIGIWIWLCFQCVAYRSLVVQM